MAKPEQSRKVAIFAFEKKENFRALLRANIKSIKEKLGKGQDISLEEYEELTRLEKLLDLEKKKARPWMQWVSSFIALAFVVGTAIAIPLLYQPRQTADIELKATVSSIKFQNDIQAGQLIPLITELDLSTLGVPTFSELKVDSTFSNQDRTFSTPDDLGYGANVIKDDEEDRIGIFELLAPASATVELKANEGQSNSFQLVLTGKDLSLEAQVQGSPRLIIVNPDDPFSEIIEAGAGSDLIFSPVAREAEELVINFTLDEETLAPGSDEGLILAKQLDVTGLSFAQINESIVSPTGTKVPRIISSIESGTLYFEEFRKEDETTGRPYQLKSGEELAFAASKGVIRELRLKDGQIEVWFRGEVEGMRNDFEDRTRAKSLMPSRLEFYLARNAWLALIGALAGSVAFIISLVDALRRN